MRAVLLFLALLAAARPPTDAEQARALSLAERFRCPTCRFVSVADSDAPISLEIYDLILEMVVDGRSDAEIEEHLVARYGDWVVFEPPGDGLHAVVWWLPPIVVALAAAVVWARLRRAAKEGGG